MTFQSANILVLIVTAAVSWWLSSYDSKLHGGGMTDAIRRGFRCGVTLLIVELAFLGIWRCWRYNDRSAGFLYIATLIPLALLWLGCITEILAQAFHGLVDPQDSRPYDPNKGVRELDAVGVLIRSGRKQEAVQLCRLLIQTSEENRSALELALHHLNAPVEAIKESKPLAEASLLRQEGKFNEAEAILNSLWRAHPPNVDAALMLMRLYAQNLQRPDKAANILRSLEKQRHVPAAYIEFARRSIAIWQKPPPRPEPPEPVPESIEELLAKKYFGTAVDALEKQAGEEPANFDVWMKLAEVHGRHCVNFQLAEKVVRRIEANPAFNPEQKDQARNTLRAWREAADRQSPG